MVEGEKAAQALQRAGILAVGTVCGAADTPSDEVLRHLLHRPVILWADADDSGRKHMARIAEALHRLGHRDVRMVDPPPGVRAGWDAADAVAQGVDVRALIGSAKPYTKSSLFKPSAELTAPPVTWVCQPLVPCGALTVLSGKDKRGKTLLALELVRAVLLGEPFLGQFQVRQGPVVGAFLDDPLSITLERLETLGIRRHPELFLVDLWAVDEPQQVLHELESEVTRRGAVLAVWDALYHLTPMGREALNDASLMRPVMLGLDSLAARAGCGFVVVAHDNKAGMDVAGSFVIRAAAKSILRLTLPSEETHGDDEPVTPRRHLKLESKLASQQVWAVELYGVGQWVFLGTAVEVRRQDLKGAIIELLRKHGPATREEILNGVAGKDAAKLQALQELEDCGLVVVEGKGRKGDPRRYRLADPEQSPGPRQAEPPVMNSVPAAHTIGGNGERNRLEPRQDAEEFRSGGSGTESDSGAVWERNSAPHPSPSKTTPAEEAGPSQDPDGEGPLGTLDAPEPAPVPMDSVGPTPGGPGPSPEEGPESTSEGGPERPLEPPSSWGDTQTYPRTEIEGSGGPSGHPETPSARMTTRLPDGTIRLSWDGREEAVVPGDLDGWAPVEEIAHPNLPEVSPEISPTLVLDIETTGLDPTQDRILAVGLALYRDGQEEVCEVLRDTDERALLSRTFERVAKVAPRGGVLTGYNLLDFDLSFLYMRSQRLGVKCPFWPQRDGRGEVVVRNVAASAGVISGDPIPYALFKNDLGLQIVDTFHLVARYEYTTRSLGAHKDLKSVAEHFGVPEPDRVVIPHDKISEATPEELERYVRGDLRETYRVYERLVKPYLVVSRLTSLPLEDTVTRSTARIWQSVLQRHYGRTENPDEKKDYPGGIVVSRPGLYYPCVKLDIASLYPTTMLAYRIHSRKDTDAYALSWLRSLTEMRLRLKERGRRGDSEAATVQEGLKVLINSLYGFYGTGGYGFNDMDAAQRVTELGRKVLVKMIAAIEDADGVVVEADTDGVIVCAQDPQQVLAAVQQALPQPFHVDVEWTDAIVFVSDRKNYIVLDKEGCVISVKGAKWKGRDKEAIWTRFPCEFLRKLVFQGQDAAMEYAKEVEEEITSGRGWDWVKRTHRVSASDKYLLEAGFSEGEVATYAYKEKRKRVVSRSAEEGYDVGFYSTMLRRVVEELMEAIGHEGVTACNAT